MSSLITSLPQTLVQQLTLNQQRLATAESCTGGLIAKLITDIAGSSAVLDCGFVTYSNEAKQQMLGVASDTLEKYGAVSEQTVIEMASGALKNSNADIAIATSGIAGPGGGSADKPIGLVWLCWAWKRGKIISQAEHFSGDRDAIRQLAANTALEKLLTSR